MSTASPWWRKEAHADRRPALLARGRVLAALRGWFAAEGFVEVETPALQVSPGNELHLHGFETRLLAGDGRSAPVFLHTSPEFACKKLLAAGEERLFTFARVFRNRERSALHHPEFTLLEWYRAGAGYDSLMADCGAVLAVAAAAAGSDVLRWRGRTADPCLAPERLTVAAAFARHAGIDLAAVLDDRDAFAAAAEAAGVRTAPDDGWSDLFSRVLAERIEPRLGIGRPALLTDYPLAEAALARPKPGDPRFAERFELYACGVELANAFGELTDAAEQRRRFEAARDAKLRLYGSAPPIDEDFLAALADMPEAAGSALGLDRLVMLLVGAARIEQVLWAPVVDPWG